MVELKVSRFVIEALLGGGGLYFAGSFSMFSCRATAMFNVSDDGGSFLWGQEQKPTLAPGTHFR